MAEDDVKPPMSEAEIARQKEELLLRFCQEKGIDPQKIDATELTSFFETPAMKELLYSKYKGRDRPTGPLNNVRWAFRIICYNNQMKTYKNVDEYLKAVPKDFLAKVKEMRALSKKLIPKGEESIKYGMPTIEINGKNFIHFASMKGHLGFYPAPSGITAFESELKKKGIDYSKGCIRFPYDKPLPVPLITKIIKFRLKEEKAK